MIDISKIKKATGQTEASVYMTGNETNRSLDTSSLQNSNLNFDYKKVSPEEMKKALDELVIRFDTAPQFYTKQDFSHLIWCITQLYAFSGGSGDDLRELLTTNGRIVNSETEPELDDRKVGYSFLDFTYDAPAMITYTRNGVIKYKAAEGDHFFVMNTLTLYACVLDASGKKLLKSTGQLEAEKSKWQELN